MFAGSFLVSPPDGARDMRGLITLKQRQALAVAVVRNSAARINRDWRCIRQDSAEHLFLVLQKSGHSVMRQGDADVRLAPGDFIMIDSAYPSRFLYGDSGSLQYSVHLNRSEFAHRFGTAALGGCPIPGSTEIGMALRATIDRLVNSEDAAAAQQHFIGEAFFNLMGAYLCGLEAGTLASARTSDELLVTKARAYIRQRFRDPACTPASVASAMGVSLRALQRRFQAAGLSLSECLIATRLEYVCNRLMPRRVPALRSAFPPSPLTRVSTTCPISTASSGRVSGSRPANTAFTQRRHRPRTRRNSPRPLAECASTMTD